MRSARPDRSTIASAVRSSGVILPSVHVLGPVTLHLSARLLQCDCRRRHTFHDHHRRCSLVSSPHSRPIAANTVSLCSGFRAVNRAPVLGESLRQRRPGSAVLQLHVPRSPAAAFAANPPQLLAHRVYRESLLDRRRQCSLSCADCIMSSTPRSDHTQRHSLKLLVRVPVVAVCIQVPA